jgi:hypothetical protein
MREIRSNGVVEYWSAVVAAVSAADGWGNRVMACQAVALVNAGEMKR